MTEVRPARDQSDVDAALALRYEIFCVEQGVTLEEERDGRDDEALHLVGVDGDEVVATCRLLADGQGGGQVVGQHGLVGGQARERVGNGRAVVELESDDGRDGQP